MPAATDDVSGTTEGMKFKLSDHAEQRIQKRKIKLEWIEAAIENQDKIENDAGDHTLAHALKAISERNSKRLRVISELLT